MEFPLFIIPYPIILYLRNIKVSMERQTIKIIMTAEEELKWSNNLQCSRFTNRRVETLGWCEMLWTGEPHLHAQWLNHSDSAPSENAASMATGPLLLPLFLVWMQILTLEAPPVPTTAEQPATALENLSAENSPGVHFISLILPALPGNRFTEGSLPNSSALSTSGIPHGVLLA